MERFHVGKDGKIGRCKASVRACPKGDAGAKHFDNEKDARAYSDKILLKQNGITPMSELEQFKKTGIKDFLKQKGALVRGERTHVNSKVASGNEHFVGMFKEKLQELGFNEKEIAKVSKQFFEDSDKNENSVIWYQNNNSSNTLDLLTESESGIYDTIDYEALGCEEPDDLLWEATPRQLWKYVKKDSEYYNKKALSDYRKDNKHFRVDVDLGDKIFSFTDW